MAGEADVIVVGAGLAGLVAATEIAAAGKRVVVVDQEGEQNLGGQAFWSFGGLFLIDSPEQRRQHQGQLRPGASGLDGHGMGFDRDEDLWPRRWSGSLSGFRRRRKTQLAAGNGTPYFSGGRLGRTRRL